MQADFLPILPVQDIQQAAFLIQSAYLPGQDAEASRRMQQELFEIQKRPEAWGLVLPLLDFPDPNVEFFGAHTAQVKIVRDWDSFPEEHAMSLVHLLMAAVNQAITMQKGRVTIRKLFVAITSLALKLVPGRPPRWPDWILSVVTTLSGGGAYPQHILEFLEIVAQEVGSSDLVPTSKAQVQQSLRDAASIVVETIKNSLTLPTASPLERQAAFRCLEAWISHLTGDELTSIIPIAIQLLSTEETFSGAVNVLEEILSSSSYSDGSGTKILTEPILAFLETNGDTIVQRILANGEVDETGSSLCKLLVSLGEHSINYIALHLTAPPVQNLLRLLMTFTGLPGYYGADEEESEKALSFWYLLQEALWSVDFGDDAAEAALEDWADSVQGMDTSETGTEKRSKSEHDAAIPIYAELVQVLKRKVTWPKFAEVAKWPRDQIERFSVYRRDVGDTLINAYYILRQDMLRIYVNELMVALNQRRPDDEWEHVEAILHCIMSVQEAVELGPNPYLERVFSPDVLGELPRAGVERVRRTALTLIEAYASWFTVPEDQSLLLTALSYVAVGLDEKMFSLPAANALRQLCDANRTRLAEHIGEFAQLHRRIQDIPDTEKPKIFQSITSVIQALPPAQQVEPVKGVIGPLVNDISFATDLAENYPELAKAAAIQQVLALTGAAKGLTRASDIIFAYEDDGPLQAELDAIKAAREDPQIVEIREEIIICLKEIIMYWGTDSVIADTMNGLIVAITALPQDMTLISLPPATLLEVVCQAMTQDPNAVWYSLAAMLVRQLDPPPFISLLSVPTEEARQMVQHAVPIILAAGFKALAAQNDSMEENPDIVQSFFGCLEMVAQHFPDLFFEMPPGVMETCMHFAVKALTLQERYSLVASCKFLIYLLNKTIPVETLSEKGKQLVQAQFKPVVKAILNGIAGDAPASTMQNLVSLLLTIVVRCPEESRKWVPEILFSGDFITTKAQKEDKLKFAKAVLLSRSVKKMKEAAQQFAVVAKGLEGSSFGYASVSM